MGENQTLGGTRQSAPLADEMTYPLTHDEYLTLRENLEFSKFNNWEAFLLSTFITTVASVVVIIYTANVYIITEVNNVKSEKVDWSTFIVLIIYSAVCISTLLCLIISLYSKKKSKSSLERLDVKINNHLTNN